VGKFVVIPAIKTSWNVSTGVGIWGALSVLRAIKGAFNYISGLGHITINYKPTEISDEEKKKINDKISNLEKLVNEKTDENKTTIVDPNTGTLREWFGKKSDIEEEKKRSIENRDLRKIEYYKRKEKQREDELMDFKAIEMMETRNNSSKTIKKNGKGEYDELLKMMKRALEIKKYKHQEDIWISGV
jgi:hypothetical protein